MAYNAINNNVFIFGEVGSGADVAQLNDNIEDTRARVASLESVGSTLKAYESNYTWSNHGYIGYDAASSGTDADLVVTLEAPTTSTIYPTGTTNDLLNSSNEIDFSNNVFGDRVVITFEYEANTGPGNPARDYQVKIVLTDGTELFDVVTGTAAGASITQLEQLKMLEPNIGVAAVKVCGYTPPLGSADGGERKIKPISLKIEIN